MISLGDKGDINDGRRDFNFISPFPLGKGLRPLTLLATGYFPPVCQRVGSDSAHYLETPVRAHFELFTSFENIPRPRIQQMTCLAQKHTKWQMIENFLQKREIEILLKFKRFTLFKCCYRPSTKLLSFPPVWSDFVKTSLYGSVCTNCEP